MHSLNDKPREKVMWVVHKVMWVVNKTQDPQEAQRENNVSGNNHGCLFVEAVVALALPAAPTRFRCIPSHYPVAVGKQGGGGGTGGGVAFLLVFPLLSGPSGTSARRCIICTPPGSAQPADSSVWWYQQWVLFSKPISSSLVATKDRLDGWIDTQPEPFSSLFLLAGITCSGE